MAPNVAGLLSITLIAVTFGIDVFTKLGVSTWAPYPLAILAAFWWRGRQGVIWSTVAAMVLAVLGGWLSPTADSGEATVGWINRGIGLTLIALTGWICHRLACQDEEVRRVGEELRTHEQALIKATRLLRESNRSLRELSLIDEVTGIANRRHLQSVLKKEVARARRLRKPLSVILIDLDHFKAYNDAYGHQAGDECLKRIVDVLRSCLRRPGDFLGRYGGEEFVVILPGTNEEGAGCLADTMRGKVEEQQIAHVRSLVTDHVTISLGVATTRQEDSADPTDLIARADLALYKAKREGRDRVSVSPRTPAQAKRA